MRVTARQSPNFNARAHPVDMLVLHYTGMASGQAALDRMLDREAAVSAHYMVWETGEVVQLVGEDKRAWHAGVAIWQGDEDLNSRSIGIEIVNGGHDWPLAGGALPPYPPAQIEALITLCLGITARWTIAQTRIVGHSDIAPARKRDPGEHFPWQVLAEAGIGLWPERARAASANGGLDAGPVLIGRGLAAGERSDSVTRMQAMLATIGYGLSQSGVYEAETEAVVTAFQRRWRPARVTGEADLDTLAMIAQVHTQYSAA